MVSEKQKKNNLMRTASIASVTVAVTLICIKIVAYALTGSMAILSTLLDSAQDSLTSVINFFAIKQAVTPADKKHRFGHGKAQALGSLAQAVLIGIAGLFLIFKSGQLFLNPMPIREVTWGVSITLFAIVLTAVLLAYQTYVVRRTNSLSIRADRAHYMGDIMLNMGVIASILMSVYFGWDFVDALFGICVGVYLLVFISKIITESFAMLMDAEIPSDLRGKIYEIVGKFPEVLEMKSLKTRYSGNHIFIQFTAYFDGAMTLKKAHAVMDRIERAIEKVFPESDTMIHAEPISSKVKGDK